MWQSIIPKAPEDISVDEFFTKFVPDQFNQMNELLSVIDLSFLNGTDFKMQFDIEGKVYSVTFKNKKDLEVTKGSIDDPNFTLTVSEKDWRDAVTGKFNELADDFTGDPTSFIDAKRYEALMSMNGKVNMNLKKKDGVNLPLSLIFNGEENPAVTVNLDMLDALQLMNKSATGLGLFMNGKLKFTGSMVLLMKLQTLM
jgi:putative sterol carrier protein